MRSQTRDVSNRLEVPNSIKQPIGTVVAYHWGHERARFFFDLLWRHGILRSPADINYMLAQLLAAGSTHFKQSLIARSDSVHL